MLGRGMTIADQLARNARTHGDRIAVGFGQLALSYRRLDERVNRLANALRDRGVRAGDRVAVLGVNTPEILESYFAVARLGAITVPLNFRLVADELAYQLADSGAQVLLVHKLFAAAGAHVPTCLVFGDGYEEALAEASPEFDEVPVSDDEAAFIMYTSGTTGRPKGAVLTHRNLMIHTFAYVADLGGGVEGVEVWLCATPLFHIAALAGLLPTLLRAGRVILPPPGPFDPVTTVEVMRRERVSGTFLVPTQCQAICDLPGFAGADLPALRLIVWGAAAAPEPLIRRLVETFPQAEVTSGLAQTECSPVTTVLRGVDMIRKIGSVGTPMVGVEVRVVDDEMRDVPAGAVGEIVYRGPTVMREYWQAPEATAEAFHGGWFHSGDLVRADSDGYLYVVGRKKDMIISGGENIYCVEVETVLAAHPKIAEVALIGLPDAKWGERVLAIVVPRSADHPPTIEELQAWCEGKLARYKHPRDLALAVELPRNATGKVLKHQLHAQFSAGQAAA